MNTLFHFFKRNKALSWCLYDWANSAHSTIIVTFIFSVYFARSVYGDETMGSAAWAHMNGIAALLIAFLAPICGAFSDLLKQKRLWLLVWTGLCIIATASLWLIKPDPSFVPLALFLLTLSIFSVEMGISFNNAMLPDITNNNNIGKISGMAWGFGYWGGLTCLILCLILFIGLGSFQPLFTLNSDAAENIRIVAPFTALWMALFSLPIFIAYRDPKRPRTYEKKPLWSLIKDSLFHVKKTILALKNMKDKNLLLFLIASALYRDGLITIFAVGGLYAAGVYHMSFQEILIFAIGLNISAGFGSFIFSFFQDQWGAKKLIVLSLLGLIAIGFIILMIEDKAIFMILGYSLGFFMGPCQSASRVLMAQLSPPQQMSEYFGFYALTGKTAAITGPFLYGSAITLFQTQKAGMFALILLLLVGLTLLLKVKDVSHIR